MSTAPYGWTIFCDDIRAEVGNKYSLMGVYKGDLIVHGSFPVTLAKLCLSVAYRVHIDDDRLQDLVLSIFLPGDEKGKPGISAAVPIPQIVEKHDPPTRPGDTFREFQANVVLSPLTLKQPGNIKVRALGGAGLIKLGTLRVASSQPSDQPTE